MPVPMFHNVYDTQPCAVLERGETQAFLHRFLKLVQSFSQIHLELLLFQPTCTQCDVFAN